MLLLTKLLLIVSLAMPQGCCCLVRYCSNLLTLQHTSNNVSSTVQSDSPKQTEKLAVVCCCCKTAVSTPEGLPSHAKTQKQSCSGKMNCQCKLVPHSMTQGQHEIQLVELAMFPSFGQVLESSYTKVCAEPIYHVPISFQIRYCIWRC